MDTTPERITALQEAYARHKRFALLLTASIRLRDHVIVRELEYRDQLKDTLATVEAQIAEAEELLKKLMACGYCNGTKTVRLLGADGNWQDAPCPECQSGDALRHVLPLLTPKKPEA